MEFGYDPFRHVEIIHRFGTRKKTLNNGMERIFHPGWTWWCRECGTEGCNAWDMSTSAGIKSILADWCVHLHRSHDMRTQLWDFGEDEG